MALNQLIPRANFVLTSRQLQHRLVGPRIRYASTTSPPKPRVLEKPERFNPPSHPSRLRKPRQYPGPPVSEAQRQAQRKRSYPHMLPPEGTFTYWFLTNRAVHAWISMTVLLSLMFTIWFRDFKINTPYQDLLPPNNMFLSHPFAFFWRYWEVYAMHVEHVSEETQKRRQDKIADARKRDEYRRAHGLNDGQGILGGWIGRSDEERHSLSPALREGRGLPAPAVEPDASPVRIEPVDADTGKGEDVYVDFEGHPVPVKKKWFGIW